MIAAIEHSNEAKQIDVAIVYSGERSWLERLLSSLVAANDTVDLGVQLIRNRAPLDVSELARRYPLPITTINNRRSLGFAENFNQVLRRSKSKYVLVMNTDMYFSPDSQCISRLVSCMDRNPRCGIGGCRVYLPNGQYAFPARRNPTLSMIAARRLPWMPLRENRLRQYLYADHRPQDTFSCDWHSGCFMCVRKAAYRDVGGFDTRYRKYFEDVDLCQRLKLAKWDVMHFGKPLVWHDEQRASRDWLSRDAWLHLRAYWLWLTRTR